MILLGLLLGSVGQEVTSGMLRFTFGAPDSNSQQAITLTRLFATNGVVDESSATSVSAYTRDASVVSSNSVASGLVGSANGSGRNAWRGTRRKARPTAGV